MRKITAFLLFIPLAHCLCAQQNAQSYFNAGQKEYEQGRFIEAITDFSKAVDLLHSEWAYYGRGHCKYYARDYYGAIEDMDSVLLINPNNAPALRCRGAAKRMIKSYSDALDDLNKSIAISANDTTYTNRGLVKLDLKDSAGAAADFNAIITMGATTNHFIQRARLKTFLGDYKGALADYDSAAAVSGDGSGYSIKLAMAWTQMERKDYSSAIDIYTQLLKQFSGKAELFVNRGKAESNLDLDGLALKDYKRAIKAERNNPAGYIAVADFWYNSAAYLRAITAYNRAIKVNPQNAELYLARGVCKQILERYFHSNRDFSKAISLNPNYALAYRHRGDSEKALNLMKEAGTDYFKATQLGCAKE